jgi:hypothetical protein
MRLLGLGLSHLDDGTAPLPVSAQLSLSLDS